MLSRRTAWVVALAASATMMVSFIDRSTVAVLAPTLTKVLDISEAQYGWLTSAFSMAYLIATPLSGWWIDRVGARRGLLASVLLWSMVAALHAIVPTFGALFALRIALGVAEGPGFPGATQTMFRVLPPADRSRGFGLLFTGSSLGGMIAPLLASYLFDLAGWRVAFLGTAGVGLLWIPMWIALTWRPDVAAQLGPAPPLTQPPSRASKPAFLTLLGNPFMIRALVAIFAVAPALSFFATWGAKYLVARFGLTQGQVGHYLWVPPLILDVGAILFGDLAARRRSLGESPRTLFVLAALLTAALALLPLATTPWQAIAIGALTSAGGGAVYTLVTADLLGRMPAAQVSFAGGTIAGAQSLSLIIANPLIGLAVGALHDYVAVAILLGAWVVPGSLIWWAWRPRA
jgi:ACS family hexuronate transporter-like MFS transporter